ncbi:TIGR01777 family oxidoreductase, partial [Bacteroidota bacterium]
GFDEYSPAGNDFLSGVTVEWENEAKRAEDLGIRYAGIRTGIVLSKDGGALTRMLLPFKLFIGGPLGDGKQWFPWIHIDDVTGIYLHVIDNPGVNGVLNGAAPEQLVMKEFCRMLGKVLHRPSYLNVPKFALKILFGEGADMLIKGTKVNPKRTIESGYKFKFDNAESALKNLLKY